MADFLQALMRSMNADPDLLTQSGVSVIGHARRAESHVTAGYVMGEHFVVTCDPAVENMLSEAASDMEPTLEAWKKVAAAAGGELLGSGRMQLLPGELPAVAALPEGFSFRRLDKQNVEHVELIAQLIERSDEDDLDEAEIEIDNLDDIIDVVLDANDEIASYSSALPFDLATNYGDIGIMTRPEYRGRGLGSIAVAAMCARLKSDGLEPLYRCDEDNVGSIKVSAGLGFQIATQLVGYRFTDLSS